jgi:quercetin dioxygenase-like cupin family protein
VPQAAGDILTTRETGEVITSSERREAVMLTSQEDITVTYYRLAPGEMGPDPHVHHEHVDAFYVLDGEMSFLVGPDREAITLGAGGLVAAPPNFLHTFLNSSDAEARFLNLHTPDGGFGGYMRGRRDGDREVTFDTADPPDDGGLPMSEGIVSAPGEGERLVSGNRTALLKGLLPHACFIEFDVDGPLGGPPPHAHADQVDSFYVLEGELEMTVDGERQIAGPGTLAAIPRGAEHTFAHRGNGRARFLNVHAPDGGFGEFMRGNVD